jgi:general secretion pathway protein D
MKTHFIQRYRTAISLAAFLIAGTSALNAQQRGGGGGGGGGGGFGGFGGGGGNNANRSTGSGSSSGTYNNNGVVGSAIISVDPQTHNIIVISDAETSQQISNVISNLDIPKPQVLINVVFVEVQLNNSSDIGVEGGWAKNNVGNGIATGGGSVFGLSGLNSVVTNANSIGQPISSALSPGTGGAGSGGLYQIAGSDFQATLRAIAKAGKAQVLSKPSIIARDGQLAKIVVGQQVPLPSGVSFAQAGNNTIPIVNVSYTDVGIILNVTPFIGANGQVEMIVQPQISSVSPTERQSLSSDVSAPYINVRSADTVVVTPHSKTVVIGGLISDTKSDADSKVPILGDIPLLGNLFKSKQKSHSKTELLIFLTPYIVEAPTQLASLASGITQRSQLITNSVSEKELDRFLERVPVKKTE